MLYVAQQNAASDTTPGLGTQSEHRKSTMKQPARLFLNADRVVNDSSTPLTSDESPNLGVPNKTAERPLTLTGGITQHSLPKKPRMSQYKIVVLGDTASGKTVLTIQVNYYYPILSIFTHMICS
jgi:hypothetical protein